MAGPLFKVVFEGRLVEGAQPESVKAALARLFKAEPARIEAMFTGAAVVVRRQVDEATARQYMQALEKAGAVARLESMEDPAPEASPPPSAAAAAAKPSPPVPAALATPAPAVLRAMQAAPRAPALDVAAVGSLLVDATPVPDADIATDHLTLAAAGTLLVDPVDIPEPAYDLSAMSLAPVGADILEPVEVPDARFDLSGLSLAPHAERPDTTGRGE